MIFFISQALKVPPWNTVKIFFRKEFFKLGDGTFHFPKYNSCFLEKCKKVFQSVFFFDLRSGWKVSKVAIYTLFYKQEGELLSTKRRYYTFWKSKALFTNFNFNHHFKKRGKRNLIMVSYLHSGSDTTHSTSGNYDGKNLNIEDIRSMSKK